MGIVDLLKQFGLSQYEAEAYTSLLREGPLTGYELGKRSKVALPRIYDVLARLQTRGLVLVQPGDPPRYRAEDPAIFLRRLRAGMTSRLDELEEQLLTLSSTTAGEDEFWVIRGRDQIRDRAAAMIEGAEHTLILRLPAILREELASALEEAHQRGCHIAAIDGDEDLGDNEVLVLADDRELLAGTLAEPPQALVSRNRALVALARPHSPAPTHIRAASLEDTETGADWLVWEADKQRRLRLLTGGSDVA
jgi:sugar-specific transcriptional regulator TrmB